MIGKKRRVISMLVSAAMVCCLVGGQALDVHASVNTSVSTQQLETLFDGTDSIVTQLEGLGLSDTDIADLLALTPRETSFYSITKHLILIMLALLIL